jgi:hypothetical protein
MNVITWYNNDDFSQFKDRKMLLYNKSTMFFHKICLFVVYFSVELIFEKIQEMLKDAQSFRIVESQFPGQVLIFPNSVSYFFRFFSFLFFLFELHMTRLTC